MLYDSLGPNGVEQTKLKMAGAVVRVEGSEQSTKTLHLYAMVGKLSGLFWRQGGK